MAVSREALLRIVGEDADARAKIDAITAKAEELKRLNPEVTVQIDSAKARAEAAILRAELKKELGSVEVKVKPDVSGFRAVVDRLLVGRSFAAGGGGGPGGLLGALGQGSGGAGSTLATALGQPVLVAAGAAAVASLIVEITGLVSGLAAATAGVGAFGILAIPTLNSIRTAYTNISAAQDAYNKAAEKQRIDPTKANARAVADALVNLKVAQDQAGPGTAQAVRGVQQLGGAFHDLARQLQPTVLAVFNDALKVANTLLPDLKPFAEAAGGAIDGLLGKVNTFFQSADFRKWLDKFVPLVGPAITAIGTGVGKVSVAVGNLLTKMSAHDVVHAINIVFDSIAWIINTLGGVIARLMSNWDRMTGAFAEGWQNIRSWTATAVGNILEQFGRIVHGAADAFGWIPGIGGRLKEAAAAFDAFTARVTGDIRGIPSYKTITISAQYFGPASPLASGGSTYRSQVPGHHAAGGASSGLTWVGERGPELLYTPPGSYVYNHARSVAMTGGRTEVVLRFEKPSDPVIAALVAGFRGYIHARGGGNVQTALGTG